jgi:hypothetical protein
MLHGGTGWEVEYPRDVWRLERLPGLTTNPGKAYSRDRLRFDQIAQPWLRGLVKRWSRLRLSSGLAVGTVVSDVQALRRFSAFLAEAVPEVDAVADLDRALLERYLAWLATDGLGHGAREDAVTCLGMFFQAVRQHDWDRSLPTTAVFFAGADLDRERHHADQRVADLRTTYEAQLTRRDDELAQARTDAQDQRTWADQAESHLAALQGRPHAGER